MELHPPIEQRTDIQLKEIVAHPTHYRDDVVKMAVQELWKRGYGEQELLETNSKGKTQEIIKEKHEKKLAAIESYSIWDWKGIMFLIMAWPLTIVFMIDHKKDGRTRKLEQSYYFVGIGIIVWLILLS